MAIKQVGWMFVYRYYGTKADVYLLVMAYVTSNKLNIFIILFVAEEQVYNLRKLAQNKYIIQSINSI